MNKVMQVGLNDTLRDLSDTLEHIKDIIQRLNQYTYANRDSEQKQLMENLCDLVNDLDRLNGKVALVGLSVMAKVQVGICNDSQI